MINSTADNLHTLDVERFHKEGFVILRGAIDPDVCQRARSVALACLSPLVAPVEYEADVGYPGAPDQRLATGGDTPRRLLHAYARDAVFAELANTVTVTERLRNILGDSVHLSQCHHNCVMTKYPGHSSATLWHQDIRYWSFDRPELVTAWFALGGENRKNGALRVIPGSHLLELDRGRLDSDLFLRPELPENKTLIRQAEHVELQAGDVLLFHCRLFHAAGKNLSSEVKLSPVFSYHAADNLAIPGTRSAKWAPIKCTK
ncbi:MAG: phytanoyl-CoA hydroxylase [Limisphaerales bacterium]|jgi:phytanoyl-CoA hydroxylase